VAFVLRRSHLPMLCEALRVMLLKALCLLWARMPRIPGDAQRFTLTTNHPSRSSKKKFSTLVFFSDNSLALLATSSNVSQLQNIDARTAWAALVWFGLETEN
jgi:hypothetical protein